ARHGALGLVDDRDQLLALLLGVAHRLERIQRLAGLRYEERDAALDHVGRAIAEFRGDLYLGRQARDALQPVFGNEAGMERGAAADDRDLAHILERERQSGKM